MVLHQQFDFASHGRFRHELEASAGTQKQTNALPDQGVIFSNDDFDHVHQPGEG